MDHAPSSLRAFAINNRNWLLGNEVVKSWGFGIRFYHLLEKSLLFIWKIYLTKWYQ